MRKKNKKVLYKFLLTIFALIIITAGIFFSTFFTGFAPLDDYIIYDDFSDTNYEASSTLETIQMDVCMPNSCGGEPDGEDEFGCQKWKDLRTRTVKYNRKCYWQYYGGSQCYDTIRKSYSCPSGYTGIQPCSNDAQCVCTKQENYYVYCGGSSGEEASSTKTFNLPEDTKLVIIKTELPDNNAHTFTINSQSISVSKTCIGTFYTEKGISPISPSIITFILSDYDNRKMNFGSNTIQTDIPLTIYIQTGNCENYESSNSCSGSISPEGANILSTSRRCVYDYYGGSEIRRHLQCYYPKWSGREELMAWYQIPYGGDHSILISSAEFKPSLLGKISFNGDISVKDFKNSDIKIKYYGKLGIDIVELKENILYQKIESSVSLPTLTSTDQDHVVEIIHSKITPNEIHIYNDGTHIGNIIADFDNYHIKLHSQTSVGSYTVSWSSDREYQKPTPVINGKTDYIKFKIPFNCKIFDDEQLVYEDYYPEEVIKLDENFKLSEDGCEVMKFCLSHPTVLSEQSGSSTDYENEIYQSLVSGKALTVPSDQTWKLIFITKKDSEGRCEKYTPTFINETYVKELEEKLSIKEIQLQEFESEISTLNQLIAERNLIKDDLETSINDMDNEIVILQDNLDQQTITIAELQVQLESKEEKTDELQVLISQAQTQIDDLITILQEKENLIKELISERLSQENRILELLENLQEKEEKLAEIEGMSDAQIAELERIKDMFDEQKAKIIELQGIVDEDYTIIDGIKQDNDDMKYTLKELTDKNEELKDKTDELSETVTQEQQKAEEFKVLLEATKQTVETLKQENIEQKESFIKIKELSNEQEALLDELKKKNKELENILNEKKDFNWLYVIIPVFLLLVIVIFLIAKPKKKKRKKK